MHVCLCLCVLTCVRTSLYVRIVCGSYHVVLCVTFRLFTCMFLDVCAFIIVSLHMCRLAYISSCITLCMRASLCLFVYVSQWLFLYKYVSVYVTALEYNTAMKLKARVDV